MKRLHAMPFGACLLSDGSVCFRLWAPAVKQVELILKNATGKITLLPMLALEEGWFQMITSPLQAQAGTLYRYRLDNGLKVPDPASRANPQDVHGFSQVVDAAAFSWQDDSWQGRPWYEAVIYELHLGTFTKEGTFAAAMQRLDYLVELGITAIELMPVADFSGSRNWGYDGVLLFAPDSSYGTPDELKELVQAAHARGLMIFLDVVYNHFGPDGNYLHTYAPQFFSESHHTPWGAAINFDGNDSRMVRDFFIHNAVYWLEEYHFDGLRLDAIHAIVDDSQPDIVTELSVVIHEKFADTRQVHLILENEANAAHYLQQDAIVAQWNDDIHHVLHVLLTQERDGYYIDYAHQSVRHLARCLAEGFAFQGEPSAFRAGKRRGEPSKHLSPSAFINFTQTHDQIGNRAYGERIAMLAEPKPLQIALAILLLAPSPPMLFMGEEFAAATPFQFFCDFQGKLATAVTEGRRREFAGFREFASPAAQARIPDPNNQSTFERCKLDWDCLNQPQHKAWLEYYQQLLTLRRTHIVPHLSGIRAGAVFELIGVSALSVRWSLENNKQLLLVANLGDVSIKNSLTLRGTPVYLSQTDLATIFSAGTLPPWCAAWFIEEERYEKS